jgi:2-polyprenyl-3-methyl-5-hydroxy-6-metoxy-1,4-benzoquinol methylase
MSGAAIEPETSQTHLPRLQGTGVNPSHEPTIGVLVVAYNAASTLASVLDRVPQSFRGRISEIFVCDDASPDSTYLVGLGYQQLSQDLPLTVVRHPQNLGYGGNQKAGYHMAIESNLDIIVMLHGDGQYAPEFLPEIVAPLERGEADAVFGSRMMTPGAAREGGMPLYKYVGNRILTNIENTLLETDLSEFHSGYRAYSVEALKSLPFDEMSDDFNFDTQIIIQLVDQGKRIVEVPIPTYYGDEICYVNGMRYARDITSDVVKYRMSKMGFASGKTTSVGEEYGFKQEDSSHAVILKWLANRPKGRLLDLGCSSGLLSERARALGHEVIGVDLLALDGIQDRVDRFIQANLDSGLPAEVIDDGPYDIVVAADILEHIRDPERLLADASQLLTPGGVLISSVPNFSHWYARGKIATGRFDYDQRGILDKTHVRFFTRRTLTRTLEESGFRQIRQEVTGLPLDVLLPGDGRLRRGLRSMDTALVAMRPTLFGYQFVTMSERADALTAQASLSVS